MKISRAQTAFSDRVHKSKGTTGQDQCEGKSQTHNKGNHILLNWKTKTILETKIKKKEKGMAGREASASDHKAGMRGQSVVICVPQKCADTDFPHSETKSQ